MDPAFRNGSLPSHDVHTLHPPRPLETPGPLETAGILILIAVYVRVVPALVAVGVLYGCMFVEVSAGDVRALNPCSASHSVCLWHANLTHTLETSSTGQAGRVDRGRSGARAAARGRAAG